jgi:hypothetical protein
MEILDDHLLIFDLEQSSFAFTKTKLVCSFLGFTLTFKTFVHRGVSAGAVG